ncbi:MAG: peptidase inhibitor family I36 protein [Acidobacteriota bacterium]
MVLFEHINFQGKSITITGPANISSLVGMGWNDRVSSFRAVPN